MLGWVQSHPWSPFAMGCIAWATIVFIVFPAVSLEFHVIYMVTIASLIYILITRIAPRLDSCLIVLAMLSHGWLKLEHITPVLSTFYWLLDP